MFLKRSYITLRNALLFFFVINVFSGIDIKGGNLAANISTALIFGILMTLIPFMLGFFRINVNLGSRFLLSAVVNFIVFLLIYTGLWEIGSIGGSVIDLGLWPGTIIRLDPMGTLLGVSVVLAAGSVLLHWMSGEASKW